MRDSKSEHDNSPLLTFTHYDTGAVLDTAQVHSLCAACCCLLLHGLINSMYDQCCCAIQVQRLTLVLQVQRLAGFAQTRVRVTYEPLQVLGIQLPPVELLRPGRSV